MHGRYGSAEATQDQILVCVVPYVLDRHVMEKMTVCAQDVVTEVFHLHFRRSSQAVQAKPAHRPGNLLVFRDRVLDGECMHSHRDWLARKWDVPVQLHLLHRHVVNGNSGWGRGAVIFSLIASPHPDPCLSGQSQIRSKEGIQRRPRLGRPVAPVLLELCLDLLA